MQKLRAFSHLCRSLAIAAPLAFADKPVLQWDTQQFINSLNEKAGKPIFCMTPTEARAVLSNAQANFLDLAPATKPLPVVMYFHGGGWVLGDFKTHERLLRELTNAANAAIVFVDYSPAPQAKYPTQINEAYAATKWIAENGKSFNLDTSKIAVAGDSVGGEYGHCCYFNGKRKHLKLIFKYYFTRSQMLSLITRVIIYLKTALGLRKRRCNGFGLLTYRTKRMA